MVQSEGLGYFFTPLTRSPPLCTPLLGSEREGVFWLSYFWAQLALSPGRDSGPPARRSSMLPLVCPPPETEDTAQCPVLAEPLSHSQLQEDKAGQVGFEPA